MTTRFQWFTRGALGGMLLCGALNAASYYARSDQFGDLLGNHPTRNESLGFPLEMWQDGNAYGGYFIDLVALCGNLACAAFVGGLLGAVCVAGHRRLDRLEAEFESSVEPDAPTVQFSIRGMLVAMCLACGGAAVARVALAGRPVALGAIYLLGPWALVGIALVPQRISWQLRIAILVPITLLLGVSAIGVGASLERPLEFDRVLLGIFVSWTPQTALVAVALTVWIVARAEGIRREADEQEVHPVR